MQNTGKQNYPCSVTFYDIRPGNKVGLFYLLILMPSPTDAQALHFQTIAQFFYLSGISIMSV